MQTTSSYKLWSNLLVVYIVWGSTFLGVRYAVDVLPPLFTNSLRFLTGGILLLLFTFWRGYGVPITKQWLSAMWVGMLLSGIGNCAVAYAIHIMPTGLVALQVATIPLWMVMLDTMFFSKQKPPIVILMGLLVGLIGMSILLNPFAQISEREVSVLPAFILTVGAISWAWGSLQSPYLNMPPQMQTTAIQMLGGGIFSFLLSMWLEPHAVGSVAHMTSTTYLALAYLIVIGSFIGYSSYVWLLHHAPPALTSTYAYVNPVVAIVLGGIFLHEKLSNRSLIAAMVVLLGVVMITIGRRQKKLS